LKIPPPRIEKPDLREPLSIVRKVPVPAAEPKADELEPVYEEPERFEESAEAIPSADLPLVDAVPPPPRIVEAGTAGLVLPARLPGGDDPLYPSIARAAGVGGTVMLSAIIDEEGNVEEMRVVRAPNPDLGFSEAAISAVATWKYRPGVMHGRSVGVRLTVWIDFTPVR
jgi:TonB family protein